MEPFNAVSNLIFIICAAVCVTLMLRDWTKLYVNAKFILCGLSTLIMFIGMGSAAFHLKPTHTTHALDLIPIGLFILLAIISILKMGFNLGNGRIIAFVLLWCCATAFASRAPEILAGSLVYVPTLVVVMIMAILNPLSNQKLVAVFGFLGLGLVIRAIDLPLCNTLPIGTHWLWHLCTALAALQTFLLLLQLCKNKANAITTSV